MTKAKTTPAKDITEFKIDAARMNPEQEYIARSLSPFIDWNPEEEGLTPKVDIKVDEVFKRLNEFYKTFHPDLLKRLAKKGGKSSEEIINLISMGDHLQFGLGLISKERLVSVVSEGVQETGYYKYTDDNAEKWIQKTRAAAQLIYDVRNAPSVDMSKYSLELPGAGETIALNKLLETTKLPPLESLVKLARSTEEVARESKELLASEQEKVATLESDTSRLQAEVARLLATAGQSSVERIESDGTIPEGEVKWVPASEVFDTKLSVDFSIPVWTWEGVHPLVPQEDEHYIFRAEELEACLYAIISNQRSYFHGHTGTGKTTLIEQVAARLNYPFVRINFDSEISRMDLIGRDILRTEDGHSVSEFIDGILPKAMSTPCLMCCDEIDFVRPDVAYVLQSALEGNGLRITEDGDRFVTPHSMFRMFATGNTVGQGDEDGLYQGARPQSSALLDRFTIWRNVDYLSEKDREALVSRHVPSLSSKDTKELMGYITDHIAAFTETKVMQPISPRGMLAIAKATVVFGDLRKALTMCVLDRASKDDRATLLGIVDRFVS